MAPRRRVASGAAALVAAAVLPACASLSKDGAMAPVVSRVSLELGRAPAKIATPADAAAARQRVSALLGQPLTGDAAVRIALLNDRGLQAEYNALGVSEAAFVEASLPPSPTVSFERVAASGDLDVERRLVADLLALLTLPERARIAETELRAARQRAIVATFRAAAEARRAWIRAVAARETVGFLETARSAAGASAELTTRLGETGAATTLDQARSGALYAEVAAGLAEARLDAAREREALTRALGLWGREIDFRLPARLPPLSKVHAQAGVEAAAIRGRADLAAHRLALDALARRYGLTERARALSMLDVAGLANRTRSEDGDRASPKGFEVAVEIPIFDFGAARSAKARETYLGAANRLFAKAVEARSQAREAYLVYRARHDIARVWRDRVVPLRKIVSEETQLRYNGMLVDPFELLTTARETVAANLSAIRARRDAFLAEVDLEAALNGAGPAGAPEASAAATSSGEGR